VLSDFTLMTTDVDSSKSTSLAVDSLLAVVAPDLSDRSISLATGFDLEAYRRRRMAVVPGSNGKTKICYINII